jgi:ribonuclease D
VKFEHIKTDEALGRYCEELKRAKSIAFDTEFVAEDTYRPQLCLVQIVHDGQYAIIDPLDIDDLTPLWRALAEPAHVTIVHAGRQEIEFSFRAIDGPPAKLFDVQIAAGLVGLEYPASYATLVGKLLGHALPKGETRTDWRRRPLTDRQLQYALEDVRHLHPLHDALRSRLERLGRSTWLDDEMTAFESEIAESLVREKWRRISGTSGLSSRSLAVVRELWRWREEEAKSRNLPPRRILRDDLIAELARRRTADPAHVGAIRGMERGELRRAMPQIADAVRRALDLADEECPRIVRQDTKPNVTMMGQFLASALASICRAAEIAPGIVGTVSDVRDLVAYRLDSGAAGGASASPSAPRSRRGRHRHSPPRGAASPEVAAAPSDEQESPEQSLPALMRGWRAEIVGNLLDELLLGRVGIKIDDPLSDHPLSFVPLVGEGNAKLTGKR